jgi:hypothetical protein
VILLSGTIPILRCAFVCAFVARHIPILGCVMALIGNCVFFHLGMVCMGLYVCDFPCNLVICLVLISWSP